MSNKPQGNLPNNTEDPRRKEKEYCKIINLRSGKDVHIPVGVPKRRMEPVSTQEEAQVEGESQPFNFQHTSESSQATTTAEKHDSIHVEEEAAVLTSTYQSRAKEK